VVQDGFVQEDKSSVVAFQTALCYIIVSSVSVSKQEEVKQMKVILI
jgi:hypothetical protein